MWEWGLGGGCPDSAGLDLLHGCARQRAQQAVEQQGRSSGPPVMGVSIRAGTDGPRVDRERAQRDGDAWKWKWKGKKRNKWSFLSMLCGSII